MEAYAATTSSDNFKDISHYPACGQTFRVVNRQLDEINLFLSGHGQTPNVTIKLYKILVPRQDLIKGESELIGQSTRKISSNAIWNNFDINLDLDPNFEYAFRLETDGGSPYWYYKSNNPYVNGEGYITGEQFVSSDFGFVVYTQTADSSQSDPATVAPIEGVPAPSQGDRPDLTATSNPTTQSNQVGSDETDSISNRPENSPSDTESENSSSNQKNDSRNEKIIITAIVTGLIVFDLLIYLYLRRKKAIIYHRPPNNLGEK